MLSCLVKWIKIVLEKYKCRFTPLWVLYWIFLLCLFPSLPFKRARKSGLWEKSKGKKGVHNIIKKSWSTMVSCFPFSWFSFQVRSQVATALRTLAAKSCSRHFRFDIQARVQRNDLTKSNRYRVTNFLYNLRSLLLNCLHRVSDFKLRLQHYKVRWKLSASSTTTLYVHCRRENGILIF